MNLDDISIKIKNYKCFGPEEYGYERILPVNLIIGRNNTGKSTLLDLIDYATSPKDLNNLGHKGQIPKIILSDNLTEKELRSVFQQNASGGYINGNHWDFGKKWIGKRVTVELNKQNKFNFMSLDPPLGLDSRARVEDTIAHVKVNPFSGFIFKRLFADRDVTPEVSEDSINIQPNGRGATNTIQNFINKAVLPSALVEDLLLKELNSIFEPDGTFTDIVVQQLQNNTWEVYLEETEKGRVPLSHTGSGLKTIILVLIYLHLVPHIENNPLSRYFFGFEELENNLHPAVQRRLLLYLRKIAIERGCHLFITTHSNIVIDLFSKDDKAQILHIIHNRICASVKQVTTYVENKGILDDLDIRASDLLQANGIVWVEGPSDRLYFNRWIELVSKGEIKEGAHYQCVFYGGRLLAHLSATDPDFNLEDLIKILRVNRNAILIIDSDRESEGGPINTTKQRIISEINTSGGMDWVTAGREVENYIPIQVLTNFYTGDTVPMLGPYEDFSEYLDKIKPKEGKRFLRNKAIFAERICQYITEEAMSSVLDLKKRANDSLQYIKAWNGL